MLPARFAVLFFGSLFPLWFIAILHWPLFRRTADPPWDPVRDGSAPIVASHQGVILSADSSAASFPPCTRSRSPIVLRYWTPTLAQVNQLERDIAPYLPHWDSTFPWYERLQGRRSLHRYYRQYLGIVLLDGTQEIYVNGIAPLVLAKFMRYGWGSDWRQGLVHVCDGADSFWNVEYDPVNRRFRAFSFDGS